MGGAPFLGTWEMCGVWLVAGHCPLWSGHIAQLLRLVRKPTPGAVCVRLWAFFFFLTILGGRFYFSLGDFKNSTASVLLSVFNTKM